MTRKQKTPPAEEGVLKRKNNKRIFLNKLCIIKNEIPSFKEKEEISIRQTPSGERRKGQENTKRKA